MLQRLGMTGRVESTLPQRLGRPIDPAKKELGRLIFFDKALGLHRDNSCAGCHSPTNGFGDTQPIAIGIQNNNIVGPDRKGPRNQRRTPMVINVGFYPKLMWNSRFAAASGDPFDNSLGWIFPLPEGENFFPEGDSRFRHLLAAQGHIPFTEQSEMAGFTNLGTRVFTMPKLMPGTLNEKKALNNAFTDRVLNRADASDGRTAKKAVSDEPSFKQFDDRKGRAVPYAYDGVASLNNPIRHVVLEEINLYPEYRRRFAQIYPSVADGNCVEFHMIGDALAEFQLSLTFTDAPIDRFARGDRDALTPAALRGALLFFGRASCVECHAVSGASNEMFSDFQDHVAGVPQVAPVFGKGSGNVPFRNANGQLSRRGNQDLGRWEFTEDDADLYKFRTAPLRNIALQPAYFHNGAFRDLKDAVRYHTDTLAQAAAYDPVKAGVPADLRKNIGPSEPVLTRLDSRLREPVALSDSELDDLVAFLRDGLLDERARPEKLKSLIPAAVPSGAPLQAFQFPAGTTSPSPVRPYWR